MIVLRDGDKIPVLGDREYTLRLGESAAIRCVGSKNTGAAIGGHEIHVSDGSIETLFHEYDEAVLMELRMLIHEERQVEWDLPYERGGEAE